MVLIPVIIIIINIFHVAVVEKVLMQYNIKLFY